MEIESFAVIESEFMKRVHRIAWCSVATVDRVGGRARLLHPLWEGATGWIATNRHSHKAKHLERTPQLSLSYWDPQHEQIYAD